MWYNYEKGDIRIDSELKITENRKMTSAFGKIQLMNIWGEVL